MIKEITYEFIWSEIIEPTIVRIKTSIQTEMRTRYNFTMQDLVLVKNSIYTLYEKKRDRIKELYHFDNGEGERLIDIHKIAACFAAVLIENPIFEYSMEIDGDVPDCIFLANAELSYSVSLGIIYIGLIGDYAKLDRDDLVGRLTSQGKLLVPQTTKGHDDYNLGRIKTIALNDVFDIEFDVLTYSDMMFWIEFYNRQKLELC